MTSQRSFPTHMIHGPEQMLEFNALIQAEQRSKSELLFLAAELPSHGLFDFPDVERQLRAIDKSRLVSQFLDKKQTLWTAINSMPTFRPLVDDRAAFTSLYSRSEPYFEKGATYPDTLIIIFCSIFNNIFVSNVAFAAALRALGYSMLFIKDPSRRFYLHGASEFGDSFRGMVDALDGFIERGRFKTVALVGYSSSGYGALRAAISLKRADCFIGLSIRTNLTKDADIDTGAFFEGVRGDIPSEEIFNLKDVLQGPNRMDINIVYGSNNELDRDHALNLRGLDRVRLIELEDCDHDTPAFLLTNDLFDALMKDLLG